MDTNTELPPVPAEVVALVRRRQRSREVRIQRLLLLLLLLREERVHLTVNSRIHEGESNRAKKQGEVGLDLPPGEQLAAHAKTVLNCCGEIGPGR